MDGETINPDSGDKDDPVYPDLIMIIRTNTKRQALIKRSHGIRRLETMIISGRVHTV